jgi:hypothetical protein
MLQIKEELEQIKRNNFMDLKWYHYYKNMVMTAQGGTGVRNRSLSNKTVISPNVIPMSH